MSSRWASTSRATSIRWPGGGLHGERHAGHRSAGGPAGAGPGRHPPDAGRSSTGPRRCARRCSTCSTVRSSNAAKSTRSETSKTIYRNAFGPVWAGKMTAAYHAGSALQAEAALLALGTELDRTHPGAAASLREGLDETLTVLRLGVPPTLARTLRSTNCIESMFSVCREHAANVKRWRDGQMALRWCAAGMSRPASSSPGQRPPAPAGHSLTPVPRSVSIVKSAMGIEGSSSVFQSTRHHVCVSVKPIAARKMSAPLRAAGPVG